MIAATEKPSVSLTHFQLKWLAIVSMFLDHGMKVFQIPILRSLEAVCGMVGSHILYYGILSFGRMAMLIFGFQIAEGLRHTHSYSKYLTRLCILAFVSEIPFQCVVSLIRGTPIQISFTLSNVVGTLFFGAAACVWYARALGRQKHTQATLIVLFLALLAEIVGMDYGWFGIAYIFFCCYGSRKQQLAVTVFFYGVQMLLLFVAAYGITWQSLYIVGVNLLLACATVWLLGQYRGERGKPIPKIISYGFYPVHLALLAVFGILFL